MNAKKIHCIAAGLLLLATPLVHAQEAEETLSASDIAKETQNPMADIISVPIQNNFAFGIGPDDGSQFVMNIQPVIPTDLSDDWRLINRIVLPLISNNKIMGSKAGLGDIQYQGFIGSAKDGEIIWGLGPILSMPTATDTTLGSEKWSAGPGAVVVSMNGPWVAGALVNNIWSFAGDSDRQDVNAMLIQYFATYNFDKGWYATTSPINTANWEASSGDQWTVPVGGGFGKVVFAGKLPINLQLQGYYNVVAPDNGPDWSMRFQIQTVLPKALFGMK